MLLLSCRVLHLLLHGLHWHLLHRHLLHRYLLHRHLLHGHRLLLLIWLLAHHVRLGCHSSVVHLRLLLINIGQAPVDCLRHWRLDGIVWHLEWILSIWISLRVYVICLHLIDCWRNQLTLAANLMSPALVVKVLLSHLHFLLLIFELSILFLHLLSLLSSEIICFHLVC